MLALINSLFIAMSTLTSVKYLDYGSFPNLDKVPYGTHSDELQDLGCCAFNWAPELTTYFLMLKDKYNLNMCVETGIFKGDSTITFSRLFDRVEAIDVNQNYLDFVKERLGRKKNINFHLGNSPEVLKDLLPSLKDKRPLFYLDAHWQSFWPLHDELSIIGTNFKDNCIIIIDDFKVPNRPDITYDKYGKDECSMEYIRDQLDLVFTSYDLIFLIPKSVSSKAKAVLIPTKWQEELENSLDK